MAQGVALLLPLWPLYKYSRVLNVNHDLGTLRLGRERVSLGELPRLSLAVQLQSVPAATNDFDPVGLQWVRRRDIARLDMDSADQSVC